MRDTNYCCEQFRYAVEEPEIPLYREAKFREFKIRVLDGGSSGIVLRFCPWCGEKLPDSLRNEWFDKLEQLGWTLTVKGYQQNLPMNVGIALRKPGTVTLGQRTLTAHAVVRKKSIRHQAASFSRRYSLCSPARIGVELTR